MRTFPRNLLVVARVTHYLHDGQVYAYAPYAREIDIWADLFEDVAIAGTLRHGAPPNDCSPFGRTNIRVLPVTEAGGAGFREKVAQLFLLPRIIGQLARFMRRADAIHVRCPCDLGLLGVLMSRFFTDKTIAKYAGQWSAFAGEAASWRMQKRILKSAWWQGPVTVYSSHSGGLPKVVPFFTSMLTEEQIARARVAASKPRAEEVFRVLFVGRLTAARNVDVLLRAFSKLVRADRKMECVIVGEGPERPALQQLAQELGIAARVNFKGGLPFQAVLESYESANVLVLAAETEGWGKAITEGMAFGCVCIGSHRGIMPEILGQGRGILVAPRAVDALQDALERVMGNPEEAAAISHRAAHWAQRFSIEGMRTALRQVMLSSWKLEDESKSVPAFAMLK